MINLLNFLLTFYCIKKNEKVVQINNIIMIYLTRNNCVFLQYFKENPDINNPIYSTKNGIYTEACGLENVIISWGHDDYMYLVCTILSKNYLIILGNSILINIISTN